MHKLFIRILFSIMLSAICAFAYAQDSTAANINSVMRSNNKIFVVMSVCITILVGLLLYIIRIDRKITGIEKQ